MAEVGLQESLFAAEHPTLALRPFRTQLLKWIGNKQKHAQCIIPHFPEKLGMYIEPFLGSGGILGALAPARAIAGDVFPPLMEIWETLHDDRDLLKEQYAERYALIQRLGKANAYEQILGNYNRNPTGADLVFLCRACYGGVVRFRKRDGYMSTPVGVHAPIEPRSFSKRVDIWSERTSGTRFLLADFVQTMALGERGDFVYCDPPYVDSQAILYGAQGFSIHRLFKAISDCVDRGVKVALSIDGSKYSGRKLCDVPVPDGLFQTEVFVSLGRSMLKRFQMNGQSLEEHEVSDRLLLTY
jgi:DNA adenine methylase